MVLIHHLVRAAVHPALQPLSQALRAGLLQEAAHLQVIAAQEESNHISECLI